MAHVATPAVAGLYLRISLDLTGQHLGVDRQREAATAIASARGWTPREYVDNSVSASKVRGPKSAYAQLLADARAGVIQAVIVWDIDRLTRRPREIEDWIDLAEQHGVRLVTADGEIDTATENGRMFLRIKAAVARHEVEQKSRRQKAARNQRTAAGLAPIGARALGWTADGMTVIPHEAAAVRDACTALLAGASLRSIAAAWNRAGLSTAPRRPAGSAPGTAKETSPWRPYSVRGVLANPRIAALTARKVGRDAWEVLGDGAWPPLVDEGTWRAVSALLADPTRRTTDQTVRRYLLSGIATCGVCEALITSGGRARPRTRTYRCGASNHLCRAADPVDKWVERVTLLRLAEPDAADLLVPPGGDSMPALRARAIELRADLDGLARLLVQRVLTEAGVRAQSEILQAELADVERRQADMGRMHVLGPLISAPDVSEVWDGRDDLPGMTIEAKRAAIGMLWTIRVYPPGRGARRFRSETVRIQPR